MRRIAAALLLAVPATAGALTLSSPIDCDLSGPCYIQQYVDHDPTQGATDFTCSDLTYDGHKGTDFALPTYDMIADGIDVLASAPGTVTGLRDGMPDIRYTAETAATSEGRECGNGVVIRHEGGWETQYCHLREGSITVSTGQSVQAGDPLGEVGMSGRAAFPHVHLSVRRDGAVVDPFDPDGTITCGAPSETTLWSDPMPYVAGGILDLGTAAAVPDFETVRAGTVPPVQPRSDAMVIYGFLFGTQSGDILRMALTGPEGEVIANDMELDRTQAQAFRAIGKRLRAARWPAGDYTGTATLMRAGAVIDSHQIAFTLD